MKVRILSIFAVLLLALAACNGMGGDNQEGRQDGTNNNVEPTRYNADDGRTNNMNNRNYTMDRDRDNEGRDHRGLNREDRDNTRDNDRYDIAEEAADRITDEIDVIDQAYVLTTDNNAYVAAMMDNNDNDDNDGTRDHTRNNVRQDRNDDGEELTDEVKDDIADIVQSVDNDIDNVYVSTNPDFFDLMNNYVDDMNNGQPVRGFFDQFGNMIERLFPQNKR